MTFTAATDLAALDADSLAGAVSSSRSWRQVLRTLGLPENRRARALRARCDELGISYARFRYHVFTDEQLTAVLADARSWSEAMSRLGYTEDSGSARATIRKHAARLGLDLVRLKTEPSPPPGAALSGTPDLARLREVGPYLVAAACGLRGNRVSWPLEPAVYDLLVDAGAAGIQRVQVKSSTRWADGSWICKLTRSEYASVPGGKLHVHYGPDEIDAFGIVDGDLAVYLVPIEQVAGLSAICLRRYAQFRAPWPGDTSALSG